MMSYVNTEKAIAIPFHSVNKKGRGFKEIVVNDHVLKMYYNYDKVETMIE